MDEAEQLCDRLAVMDQGKIIEINTPRNFIQELLDRGFSKPQIKLQANLEDVFLDLTGREWRD
jgi:ABC-2 type transport system ATP-binding protein